MPFCNNFLWGAATASYQVEGAWNEDGKELNIWDDFSHQKGKIDDGSTGDIACDQYHRYKEDVKLMSEMGLKAYRFSISWARIYSFKNQKINTSGIEYYNNLINELLKYNITPFVTLFHWDLPYNLHLKGGWLNPEISDYFAQYTKIIADNFGDRVKNFITFNEPSVFIGCGYEQGSMAPGYKCGKRELLQMCHNVLLSHGKAVKILKENPNGKDCNVGITLATQPKIPLSKKDEKDAFEEYFKCELNGFFWTTSYWLDPIIFGKYPTSLLSEAKDLFPDFTQKDMEIISQKIDFIGLNIYEAQYQGDYKRPFGTAHSELNWDVYPDALEWGVKLNFSRYKLPIYITENGISTHDWVSLDEKVHDPNRIDFLHRYLISLKKATDNGCIVKGYFQWSLLDNFEWARGYNPRFGLVYVDYQTQKRNPKDSYFWYSQVIKSNGENL